MNFLLFFEPEFISSSLSLLLIIRRIMVVIYLWSLLILLLFSRLLFINQWSYWPFFIHQLVMMSFDIAHLFIIFISLIVSRLLWMCIILLDQHGDYFSSLAAFSYSSNICSDIELIVLFLLVLRFFHILILIWNALFFNAIVHIIWLYV